MAVIATKEFIGVPRDVMANYQGQQLLFLSWDHHLMFAAPFVTCVPPDMRFADLVEGPLAQLIAADPDAAKIDWTRVEWLRARQPFFPEFRRSLRDNGVRHKDQLRFRTPGLNSLCAS